jgi:hypothetical protein
MAPCFPILRSALHSLYHDAEGSSVSGSVAIAAAKTLLQVLSSGVIADAGNVSASAMARSHGRERLGAGSSSRSPAGPASKEFGPALFRQFERGQMRGTRGSNPPLSTLQSLGIDTSGESFEKARIVAGFWHSGGPRERADLAVLVRNSRKLSGDDFRGPHLDPARARVFRSQKGERLRRTR